MQLLIAKHNAQTSLMPNQLVDVAVVAQHVLTKALPLSWCPCDAMHYALLILSA